MCLNKINSNTTWVEPMPSITENCTIADVAVTTGDEVATTVGVAKAATPRPSRNTAKLQGSGRAQIYRLIAVGEQCGVLAPLVEEGDSRSLLMGARAGGGERSNCNCVNKSNYQQKSSPPPAPLNPPHDPPKTIHAVYYPPSAPLHRQHRVTFQLP